ncbi:MAG TPA: MraY family glycosyltransferase [Solirubrobacteraceae bacterium]|nr:MraY family glycosyltransferase [Solirubrobacteraceae bacterium]
MVDDAFLGFLIAFVVATALTPPVARLARRVGAMDQPRARGLSDRPTPLLGGLAIFAGAAVAGILVLPDTRTFQAVLVGAAVITAVGVVDDYRGLPPAWKLSGQLAAALILVLSGVSVQTFTFPFLGRVELGELGEPVTLLGLVAIMNAVNFTDGVDGLAAGVCAISSAAFAIIAFDLGKDGAGVLALITGGAALGFLLHNFHPASVFMGDCGSNLLGLLLGATIVEGTLKTNALIALIGPLVILAVPFLDTTFVVLKRMKYGRPVYRADANHFHHRFARIGFSQRRTVAYLYAWTATMAALAVALRFVPYSDGRGNFVLGWSLVMGTLFALAMAASVYLVVVLEILKWKRWRLRQADPGTQEHEIEAEIQHDLETGEFPALRG